MIETLHSYSTEYVFENGTRVHPHEYYYLNPLNILLGDNLKREDLKWASQAGILTKKTGIALPLVYPFITSIGSDFAHFIPGIEAISLRLEANRTIIIDSKRFVKIVSFDRGEITNLLKDTCDEALLSKEIQLRESAGEHVAVPCVHRYSLDDRAFFVEELVDGVQFSKTPELNDTSILDTLFSQLFDWYGSQVLKTTNSREYLCELVELVKKSPLYEECRETVEPLLHRAQSVEYHGEFTLVQSHGDLNSRNVLKRDDELFVLDWEMAGRYVLVHDLCNFCFHASVFDDDETMLQEYLSRETISRVSKGEDLTGNMSSAYTLAYMLEKISRLSRVYNDRNRAIERVERWSSSFKSHLSGENQ